MLLIAVSAASLPKTKKKCGVDNFIIFIIGEEREPVVEQMANMMGVKAIRLGEQLAWNKCVNNNGGCSHLCFNKPKDYVCSCPLGKYAIYFSVRAL